MCGVFIHIKLSNVQMLTWLSMTSLPRNSSTIKPAVSFFAVVVRLGLSSGLTLVAILLLSGSGVVFMAATNRADLLDNALTRPGRFDWRVFISKPDQEGREAILKASQPHKDLQPMTLPVMQLQCCSPNLSVYHLSIACTAKPVSAVNC